MKLTLALMFVLAGLPSLSSAANIVCQGRLPIPQWKSDSDIGLNFELDGFGEGSFFTLWNPVTDDEDQAVPMQVTAAEKVENGTLIKAQYEREEASHLSFILHQDESGHVQLLDFQGIEGTIDYGPATIDCK